MQRSSSIFAGGLLIHRSLCLGHWQGCCNTHVPCHAVDSLTCCAQFLYTVPSFTMHVLCCPHFARPTLQEGFLRRLLAEGRYSAAAHAMTTALRLAGAA